ncbi:uncharacterized protein LOC114580965 [Dendrobium catenatum]|uniref:uncharacterized protein LOC114580965 n=1 Tax=Dendrobium catenatum TaxID=906689 RepID=UPI00109FBD3F|nr:uncharacterized protein LOC114580965 [Dendrobium catenatum]
MPKKRGNQILQIKREDGSVETNQEAIHEIIEKYYSKKWGNKKCSLEDWPKFKTSECIQADSINFLKADYMKEELVVTLRKMDNNKSPRTDGANAWFFKNYSNIIDEATWNATDEFFFKSGRMPEHWMETVVVLILKVHNAKECSKFRPICLCQ